MENAWVRLGLSAFIAIFTLLFMISNGGDAGWVVGSVFGGSFGIFAYDYLTRRAQDTAQRRKSSHVE